MDPVEALERIATLLERERAGRYKEEAFRRAADAVRDRPARRAARARRRRGASPDLPGIGSSTARVIAQALDGEVPEYLARLEAEAAPDAGPGAPIRAALARRPPPALRLVRRRRHHRADGPQGGRARARATSRSPTTRRRSRSRTGSTPSGSRRSSSSSRALNEELAPFRILTGIEVDILDDGRLDQDDDLLAELDVVVASVHSKLRMSEQPMTDRMVAAMANPHTDILGHCTGRHGARQGPARSRRSTPTSCSARARTSTRRSRSTAGPSGSTRRCACSSRSSPPAARCRSTATPTRSVSSSGSPTAVPAPPRRASPATASSTPGRSSGSSQWTASHA